MPVLVAVGSQDTADPPPGPARRCTVSVRAVVWPAKGRQAPFRLGESPQRAEAAV